MSRAEITTPEIIPDESVVELSLRPQRLSEFIGQDRVKESLRIYIDAALARREPLDHTLFFGPPGLGKTTLAELIARELGVNIRNTSGPALEKPGDLVGTLTNLREGDILFIDEIHRLRPIIEEFLYPAMEDYRIDIRLSEGPKAQTIVMPIEKFTLIGATTRLGMLTPPMRSRFGIEMRLNFYPPADLEQIVHRTAAVMQVEIDEEGAQEIAKRSRGTPRVANRLLRRIRDFAQVRAGGSIDRKVAADALQLLEVDQFGLDDMDSRILEDDHREVRRRPGGRQHNRRSRGRGRGHARGGLRAVPGSERIPPAHAARPSGDRAGVQALRLQPADDQRRRAAADAVLMSASLLDNANQDCRGELQSTVRATPFEQPCILRPAPSSRTRGVRVDEDRPYIAA